MDIYWLFWSAFLAVLTLATNRIVHDTASDITYHGRLASSIEFFDNIRYAHSPTGSLRFAPPLPFTPSPGTTINATTRGPACPQLPDALPPFFSAEPEISEDCLSLRIARPAGLNVTSSSRLPVLIWLHGGGVVKGSAYDEHNDPTNLLHLSIENGQPVIFAAVNYRLGIFGFARTPELKEAKSLNVGMRDQRMALEWVREHIAAFGGDPARITAFGMSAGGTFISVQHMAYAGERDVPFKQAFMMSGPPGTCLNTTSDVTELHTHEVARRVECDGDGEELLSCLRDVPMADLLSAATEYSVENHPPNGLFTFIPSTDGDFLPDRPSKLLHEGKFAKGVPTIVAWAEDDGALNAGPAHLITSEADMHAPIRSFASGLSKPQLERLLALYPASDFTPAVHSYDAHKPPGALDVSAHYFRLSRILRDLLFTCSSLDFAHNMLKHTQISDPGFRDVRLYSLNQSMLSPIWAGAGMPYIGVSHGSDQNYVFNGVFPEGEVSEADDWLAGELSSGVINFAYTGNPVARSFDSPTFAYWPAAFVGPLEGEDMPKKFSQLIVGGPFGTEAVDISATRDRQDVYGEESDEWAERQQVQAMEGMEQMQEIMGQTFDYAAMESRRQHSLEKIAQDQRLHERCEYILSLGDVLGN